MFNQKLRIAKLGEILALATREADDGAFLAALESYWHVSGSLARLSPSQVDGIVQRLAGLAPQALAVPAAPAEAIEKHRPPFATTRRGLGCGSCGWCVDGRCTVDPPMMWKGENAYRPMRPEVDDDTPACSRWEKQKGR